MKLAHLHLEINHLPIFGSLFGFLVLAYSMLSNSKHTIIAAFLIFIISAISTMLAYYSREGAEDVVEKIKEISQTMIKQHELFAVYALTSLVFLGILSVVNTAMTILNSNCSKPICLLMLLVAFVCVGLSVWTGYLGGKIRHTEINTIKINALNTE